MAPGDKPSVDAKPTTDDAPDAPLEAREFCILRIEYLKKLLVERSAKVTAQLEICQQQSIALGNAQHDKSMVVGAIADLEYVVENSRPGIDEVLRDITPIDQAPPG